VAKPEMRELQTGEDPRAKCVTGRGRGTGLPCQRGGRATRPCGRTHPSWERSAATRHAGKEIHGEGGHRELTKRLREEGAGACLGDADVGARSGEGERGEGEETECPGEIGDCGRRRMGAAVMCRPRQARLRDTCREF
jgi:hypothetical protein